MDDTWDLAGHLARPEAIKATYPELFRELTDIFHRHDPIGIPYCWDEYEPEVSTVLPRLLDEARSPDDAREILMQEFARWFNGDLGREDAYPPMARDAWEARNRIGAR
jgi:hypothetical protein